MQSYLPYLSSCPVISNKLETVKTSDLLLLAENDYSKLTDNFISSLAMENKSATVYKVQPLGVYLLDESSLVTYAIKKYYESIETMVVEVDYRDITRNSLIENDTISFMGKPIEKIPNLEFFNAVINNDPTYLSNLHESVINEDDVVEGDPDSFQSLFDNDFFNRYTEVTADQEVYLKRLEAYFSSESSQNRIPILLGHSGVAKSASVKALADKFGYRVVDIRLAFLSRLDLQGLSEIKNKNGKLSEIVSESSPASFMVECMDDYIDYCRESVQVIQKKLEKVTDEGEREELNRVLERFKEGAKPPVLFLDELMRCFPPIRQAFTKILSDKSFMGHSMKYAKIIAASNYAVGSEEDFQAIYQTDESFDAAFNDRFEPIPITPDKVADSWFKWAEEDDGTGKQHIHKDVLDFIDKKVDYLYDFTPVEEAYKKEGDPEKAGEVSYPNFRTWEMVSKYLYSIEKDKEYKSNVIKGLLGDNDVSDSFLNHLDFLNYGIKDGTDDYLTDFITQGLDSNVPVLLETASSMGKSSRLRAIAESRGALLIDVNLAEQDRLDLMGIPTKVPVEKLILGDTEVDEDLLKDLPKLSKFNLPDNITIKACDGSLSQKLRNASQNGQEVIIYFDEMNRLSDTTLMSAILEVISEHRFKGISFDKDKVKVVGSCNVGEAYSEVKPLDPAFSARFSVLKRPEFTELDLKSFMKYMKDNKFAPEIISYFETISVDEAKGLMNSVEKRSLETSSSSSRAWEDLSHLIKTSGGSSFSGIIIMDTINSNILKDILMKKSDETNTKKLIESIRNDIGLWAGARSSYEFKDSSGKFMFDSISLTSKIQEFLSENKTDDIIADPEKLTFICNAALSIKKIETVITDDRREAFSYIIGDSATINFVNYYNSVSEREITHYTLEDCTTGDIFKAYLTQELNTVAKPEEVYMKVNTTFMNYVNMFSNKDEVLDKEIISTLLMFCGEVEFKSQLIMDAVCEENLSNFINTAYKNNLEDLRELFNSVGFIISDEMVDKAKDYVEKEGK